MKNANNILLKLLGLLLLTGAALKGVQLLTEPVANNDIFSYRPFLIFVVEFEIALAIWLLSGLFKKAAWLTALCCFSIFSLITLYKALSGAASCGCFGPVHVNPWITLLAIDLPALTALSIFRPKDAKLFDFPPIPHFATTVCVALVIFGITTPLLAFNKPATVTSSYEVLEPQTWLGKPLPILEHINIKEKLKKGNWLILLYHHDCPDCITAIAKFEQLTRQLDGNDDFLQFALIEVPPYDTVPLKTNCQLGRLADLKEWFVTTPAIALITNTNVKQTWEAKAPDFETILENIISTKYLMSSLYMKGGDACEQKSEGCLYKGGNY